MADNYLERQRELYEARKAAWEKRKHQSKPGVKGESGRSHSTIVNAVIEKMIAFSEGNIHDIDHFLKVYAFAKTIGEQERLDSRTQTILELTAVVHDIACPLCRKKYGNTHGENQERESAPLVEAFFAGMPVPEDMVRRVSWIVSHHHTYVGVDGADYQIMLEADYLVNAGESGYSTEAISAVCERVFKTATGKRLLQAMFLREAAE